MNKLTAIIIDDELHCIETLQWQLEMYCPTIKLIGVAYSGEEGLQKILEMTPDLVFLDIEMPQMNAFEMLKRAGKVNFDVIFTTAYNQFALQAIKVSALDYLVKPIDDDELMASIEKFESKRGQKKLDNIKHLLSQIQSKTLSDRLILPTQNGLEFIVVSEVIRFESDSNYTTVFLKDESKVVVSKD